MTLFKGLYLFDIAEPAIGEWENQLGYRGMMEVWKHKNGDTIIIEVFEDCQEHDPDECGCHEVWLHNGDHTNMDTLGVYDSFEEADRKAKEFMRENPEGAFI